MGNSIDRNTQCALLSSVNKPHCGFSLRCKHWQCKHDPGPGYMSAASSPSTSVQAAHYIKDRGLGAGSICEVRTARRDTRNIGRIVGQILTRSLPTAALSKHPLTHYGLRQHERSEHNVWVNTRPDATETESRATSQRHFSHAFSTKWPISHMSRKTRDSEWRSHVCFG